MARQGQNWLEAMAQLSSKETKDKQAYEDRLHEQFQEANRRIGRVSVFKGSDHKALDEFVKNENWRTIFGNASQTSELQGYVPSVEHWGEFTDYLEANTVSLCKRHSWDFHDRSWWREAIFEGYVKAVDAGTCERWEAASAA